MVFPTARPLERPGRSTNEKARLASSAAPAFDASRMAGDQLTGARGANAVKVTDYTAGSRVANRSRENCWRFDEDAFQSTKLFFAA